MWTHHLVTALRPASAFALTASLLVSALGPQGPVRAAAQSAEPAARLQVVVQQVLIHDDREGRFSGQGEMELYVNIWRCKEGFAPPCQYDTNYDHHLIAHATRNFNARTGDTVTLDRLVPQDGDLMYGGDTSQELGFAVYAGHHYVARFVILEDDGILTSVDDMGAVFHVLDTGEHGLGLGTHTVQSVAEGGAGPGDYTLTYEIRPAPLPDLQALHQIDVHDLPGSPKQRVCMVVYNRALVPAGPFEVALRVDGGVPPDGRATAPGLAPGTNHTACVETALPTSGPHLLAAVVDAPRTVTESNETNNVYEQPEPYVATQSSPTPSPAQADLTVSAIRVRGQVPDGKDDCKDGRNDISVLVKNAGASKAGDFVVRLVVDADSGAAKEEEVADGLDAGQEHEVRFDDVRLKKGERSLLAVADPTKRITESKEDNNELKVTARCKDDD